MAAVNPHFEQVLALMRGSVARHCALDDVPRQRVIVCELLHPHLCSAHATGSGQEQFASFQTGDASSAAAKDEAHSIRDMAS